MVARTMFRTAAAVALLATTATADFTPSREENLNGEYLFSNTPGASGFTIKRYRDYPGGVDMFEVYSPEISQLYSQVFWKGLDPVDLPKEIVERYKGKGMAVVGFEMDQVRRVPSKANASVLEDVSVPLTVAYNHHFESTMVGGNAAFEKIVFDGANDPRIQELEQMHGHGIPSHKEHWTVVEGAHAGHDELLDGIPTSMAFGGANGGEYRLSYHGYAPGFAQVIQSPRQFQITPMQIDTWNRDEMPITEPSPFVPGPLPRTSEAPADAVYSGLLECPVTTRIKKNVSLSLSTVMALTLESHKEIVRTSPSLQSSPHALDSFRLHMRLWELLYRAARTDNRYPQMLSVFLQRKHSFQERAWRHARGAHWDVPCERSAKARSESSSTLAEMQPVVPERLIFLARHLRSCTSPFRSRNPKTRPASH